MQLIVTPVPDFSIYAKVGDGWEYRCNAAQPDVEAVCGSIPEITRVVPNPAPAFVAIQNQRRFRTEDGYVFYLQPDGSLTDTADPEDADMRYTDLDYLGREVDFAEIEPNH